MGNAVTTQRFLHYLLLLPLTLLAFGWFLAPLILYGVCIPGEADGRDHQQRRERISQQRSDFPLHHYGLHIEVHHLALHDGDE
jgi:hypothetical protein